MASTGSRSGSGRGRGGGSSAKRSGKTKTTRSTKFAGYQAATRWLLERTNVERLRPSRVDPASFKLERMAALVKALGDPQDDLRCVHVAGTNGKGSTVAMLTSCLRACGYAVGTYTSPHLVDLRERVQINGALLSHAACTELLTRVAVASDKLPKSLGEPTFFEIMTALALVHFAEQAVDVAILETGMGGRLDATTVVSPLVTAVTSIAFDHQAFLGDTLAAIAREKAGIFKPGVPAITIAQEPEALAALRAAAEDVGTTLEVLGDEIEFSLRFEASPQLGPHMRVGMSTPRTSFEHVPVPLPGEHQAHNCGLVLAILDRLAEAGFELPEIRVLDGLERTELPGRMEIAPGQPRILLDGAHNPAALAALVKSIGAHVPYDSMVMIFGCAADKDVDELLSKVALSGDKIIFTRAKANPRAADPADLARRLEAISPKMYQLAATLEEAIEIARLAAGREDLIVVTGSFYLVGEAKKLLAAQERAAEAV